MKPIYFLLALVIVVTACSKKNEQPTNNYQHSYTLDSMLSLPPDTPISRPSTIDSFPLRVGDTWTYAIEELDHGYYYSCTMRIQVQADTLINGIRFAQIGRGPTCMSHFTSDFYYGPGSPCYFFFFADGFRRVHDLTRVDSAYVVDSIGALMLFSGGLSGWHSREFAEPAKDYQRSGVTSSGVTTPAGYFACKAISVSDNRGNSGTVQYFSEKGLLVQERQVSIEGAGSAGGPGRFYSRTIRLVSVNF